MTVPAEWCPAVSPGVVVSLPPGPRLLARVWSNVWQVWLKQGGHGWSPVMDEAGWFDPAYAAHLARAVGTVFRDGVEVPALAVLVDWKL